MDVKLMMMMMMTFNFKYDPRSLVLFCGGLLLSHEESQASREI